MRKLILYFCFFILLSMGSNLYGQIKNSDIQLPELISEALENNPDLQSANNSWQASEARIPQASALPDPVLSFSLANLPIDNFVFDQEPMTGKRFSLMQMLPFPGKLGLKGKIAGEAANVSGLRYKGLQNQLIRNVTSVYYQLFFVDSAIETSRKNGKLIEQFTRIAEIRYRVGKGLQQDVLKAQVEYSKITDKLIVLRQRRETLEAKLNMLLNRDIETPVGNPVEPGMQLLDKELSELKKIVAENSPLLLSWQAKIRQNEQKVKLAKKGYYPDFSLGIAYTQRDVLSSGMGGVDYLSGQISMSIPLYYYKKQKKNVQENLLNQQAVEQKYQYMLKIVHKDLERTLTSMQKNKKRTELFKSVIIPQATQALNSSLSAYQVDKVEFLTLVNNQLSLFNFELEYYKALTEYQQDFAELEALLGIKLK